MKRTTTMFCALGLATATSAQFSTQMQTLPSTATEAPGSMLFPEAEGPLGKREIYFYPNAEFAGIQGKMTITRLRFRANGGFSMLADPTRRQLSVSMSSAANPHDALDASFVTNHGPDLRLVFANGSTTSLATSGGSPNNAVIDLVLDDPFVFDPTQGNDLAIDLLISQIHNAPSLNLDAFTGGSRGHRITGSIPFAGAEVIDGNVPVIVLDYEVGGYARTSTFGAGCGRSTHGSSFYEEGLTFDLNGMSWLATPRGLTYSVVRGNGSFVTPTSAAIAFARNEVKPVQLPWSIEYPTGTTQTVWVSSNGWMTFEDAPADSRAFDTAAFFAGPPRICPFWSNLDADSGGAIHAEPDASDPNRFHITWIDIPSFAGTGRSHTMQLTLDASGSFEVKYGPMIQAVNGLVGFTRGNGVQRLEPVDVSDAIQGLWLPSPDTTELAVDAMDRPVMGTVARVRVEQVPTTATAIVVMLGTRAFDPGIDLFAAGMPGCRLHVDRVFASVPLPAIGASESTLSLGIPSNPAFAGVDIFAQAAVSGANVFAPIPVATSNGLALQIETN